MGTIIPVPEERLSMIGRWGRAKGIFMSNSRLGWEYSDKNYLHEVIVKISSQSPIPNSQSPIPNSLPSR